MLEEDLNIKRVTDKMIKKAIEKYPTHIEAYKALGLCERTFYNRVNKLHEPTRYITRRNK